MPRFIEVTRIYESNSKGSQDRSLILRVQDIKSMNQYGSGERVYTQIITDTATWEMIKEQPSEILELMKKAEEI